MCRVPAYYKPTCKIPSYDITTYNLPISDQTIYYINLKKIWHYIAVSVITTICYYVVKLVNYSYYFNAILRANKFIFNVITQSYVVSFFNNVPSSSIPVDHFRRTQLFRETPETLRGRTLYPDFREVQEVVWFRTFLRQRSPLIIVKFS